MCVCMYMWVHALVCLSDLCLPPRLINDVTPSNEAPTNIPIKLRIYTYCAYFSDAYVYKTFRELKHHHRDIACGRPVESLRLETLFSGLCSRVAAPWWLNIKLPLLPGLVVRNCRPTMLERPVTEHQADTLSIWGAWTQQTSRWKDISLPPVTAEMGGWFFVLHPPICLYK